jgi:hypothetical protein
MGILPAGPASALTRRTKSSARRRTFFRRTPPRGRAFEAR